VTEAIRYNPKTVWPQLGRPFNHGVVAPAGRTIYLAGQVAWDAEGNIVGKGDTRRQTEVCFDHIANILESVGGTLADMVSLMIHWTPEASFPTVIEVRKERLSSATAPATTGVEVSALAHPDLLVELTAIAVVPEERYRDPV